MQLRALVADANGSTRGERCGLLSTITCGLEYARCWLNGRRFIVFNG